jgi:hypothetical protein
MIVRILHEGQFELHGSQIDDLNQIDNEIVEMVARNDAPGFGHALARMLDYVRKNGRPLAVDEFTESDIILPPADATLEDARHLFAGEGLVPETRAAS